MMVVRWSQLAYNAVLRRLERWQVACTPTRAYRLGRAWSPEERPTIADGTAISQRVHCEPSRECLPHPFWQRAPALVTEVLGNITVPVLSDHGIADCSDCNREANWRNQTHERD